MPGKFPEWRGRQKLKQRICEDGDPETALQCFQVSVNVIEAKNLTCASSPNGDSYVIVTLGKEKFKTFLKKNAAENNRECLLFEWQTSLIEIQKSHLWMVLMEPRCCAPPRLLGETNIDLGAIWAQPYHQVFHKWAQLTLPRNSTAGIVGFLKVDISIVCRGDMQQMPLIESAENADGMVVRSNRRVCAASEQQTANYVITVYNAFCIPARRDPRQEKIFSTYVKVTFCGVSVKTAVQTRTNNPCYCEQMSITEVFPNICQTIRLEVCSTEQILNPVLACVDLDLGQISHDGDNGFVPLFGPSLLHMYGNSTLGMETPGGEGPFYRGALLITLKTIVPFLEYGIQKTNAEPIPNIPVENLWSWEDYCIYCPILEVSMLNRQLAGKRCGVAFTVGEIPIKSSNNEEFVSAMREIRKRKLHYTGPMPVLKNGDPYGYLDFANAYPVLQYVTRLPGFKFRIYRNNFVQKIAENYEKSLQGVENRLNNYIYSYPSEILDELVTATTDTADQILNFLEIVNCFDSSSGGHGDSNHYRTVLDQKQLALQKEELEKIYHQIKEKISFNSDVNLMKMVNKTARECYSISKKCVKKLLVECIVFSQKLKTLVFKSVEGWPDIVLWLLSDGSRFAFHKFSMSDLLYSEIPELRGKDCGRIQTVYLKPLKCTKHSSAKQVNSCTCIAGKIELILWTGLFTEMSCFESSLPRGFRAKAREYDICLKAPVIMLKCRVFVYKAKLTFISSMIPPSAYVRINVLNSARETQVMSKTSTPIWDRMLTVTSMVRSSQGRIVACPPELMIEVYHYETSEKSEIIGCTRITPVVVENGTTEYAPQLRWYDLTLGHESTGQILISAVIQQLPETLVKSTIYNSLNELEDVTPNQEVFRDSDDGKIEEIPRSIKPKYSAYKVDVYWWGLREMSIARKPCAVLEIDDLSLKSDIIPDKKSNCNFPHGRMSQTFVGNFETSHFSPLTIKLYDSSTFGRIIFCGTKAVKNPTKYLIDWMSKHERESSLKTASFLSSDFIKVTKGVFVKKSITPTDSLTEFSKISMDSSRRDSKKCSTWMNFFCKTKSEEQFVLLPMYANESNCKEMDKHKLETKQDWWSRYFSSQKKRDYPKSSGNRKIKIFDSELERQPEFEKFRDWCKALKLYNGMKTGIVEKDAERRCGLLKVGLAIYRWPPPPDIEAVSRDGVDLDRGFFNDFPVNDETKFLVRVYVVRGLDFPIEGLCHPYITVKCGSKRCGDRNDFQENNTSPIFGRTYELQCLLPDDYLLTVSVHNRETLTDDMFIGSTDVDLEDRIYSAHRGRIGLASEYNVTGPAKWRDSEKPSGILSKLCARNHLRQPSFPDGNTVLVNGVVYRDDDKSNTTYITATERRENLCLSLLNRWHTLPLCGYPLVPEHVETRTLHNSETPGVDKGKLLMWIDIFPLQAGAFLPLPVDITPRKVEDYELRVIVWHVQSLARENLMLKKKMDLYVKAWIGNVEQAHYTDIHYNSLDGSANFNWRMIFDFKYQHADKKLVLTEKGPFTEYEEHLPPILVVQVADSDANSADDFLATLTLDLSEIPRGSREMQRTIPNNIDGTKKVNLFSARSLRSWWPLKMIDEDSGITKVQGMIDLELHLLPKNKALVMPVGIGREPPFPLPIPNRAEPSKSKSPVFESFFHHGGVEYIIIGFLILLLFVVCFCDIPMLMTKFVYYYY